MSRADSSGTGDRAVDRLLTAAREGQAPPLVVVAGDRPLAEPVAHRLAAGLGDLWGTAPTTLRHPDDLGRVVEDLETFSLFEAGKVVVAVGTGALADRSAASQLVAEALASTPFAGGPTELLGSARQGALALLRVLRLFDLDPTQGAAESLLARLPAALFATGAGGRGRKAAAAGDPREALVPLLHAAVEAGLRGLGADSGSRLADLLRDGLPERHVLILAESAIADGHPLVAPLERRGGWIDTGRLESERGRIDGLERLVGELERETGVPIRSDAATELARRTLRGAGRRGAEGAVDTDSTERFGAEYRKLAALAGGGEIHRASVEAHVEDRGEEDVWDILSAFGAGKRGEALARLERRLASAEDSVAERLSFFGQLAAFLRHVVAVRGIARSLGVGYGESFYPRFKSEVAPRLQGSVPGMEKNPLAGVHPYRVHRAYLAAERLTDGEVDRIPAELLATERRLKGDSGEPDAALAALLLRLSPAAASGGRPAPASGQIRRRDR